MKAMAAIGSAFLAFVLVLGANAGGDAKKEKAKGQLPFGWKDLNLSAEQKERVYKIQAGFKTKAAELNEKLAALKAEEKAEMVKVLTDEQKEHLRKLTLGEAKKTEKKSEK